MAKTTTKKKASAKQRKIDDVKIMEAYIDFVNEHGRPPASVYKFMKELGGEETDFYTLYGSFNGIPAAFWKRIVGGAIETCEKDDNWAEFSAREKMLSFFYTVIENLKYNRSFAVWTIRSMDPGKGMVPVLKGVRDEFNVFSEEVINAGMESGEIVDRPVLSKRYKDALWLQFLFILAFWRKDNSAGFESTDAAIEKSVGLAFQFLGKGPLDSMIDFGKFLYSQQGFSR